MTGGTYTKSVIGTATPTLYGYVSSWNTTSVPGGTYTLQSLATDAAGNTAYSAGVSITVDNTATDHRGPRPLHRGGAQRARASPSTPRPRPPTGSAIAKVQFVLTGGTYTKSVIGTATPTLYGYVSSWNTTSVPGGTYTLQSLATDAAGNTAYSAGVSITVDNTPPTTAVLVPSRGGAQRARASPSTPRPRPPTGSASPRSSSS